jgi:hypothetical protein
MLTRQFSVRFVVRLLHLLHMRIVQVTKQQRVLLRVLGFVLDGDQSILEILNRVVQLHGLGRSVCELPSLLVGFLLLF